MADGEAGVEIELVAAEPSPKRKRREPPSKMCAICTSGEAKYTCPKCQVRTCSLACVRKHKETTGCDGQRDRVAYVRVSEMGTSNLISDMRFLEEVEMSSGGARRHLVEIVGDHAHIPDRSSLKRPRATLSSSSSSSSSSASSSSTRTTGGNDNMDAATQQFFSTKNPLTGGGPMAPPALAQKRSRREKLLTTAAKAREIDLILLSTGMQRRAENNTHYHKKEDRLNWQIQWVYRGRSETTEGNDENETLPLLSKKIKTLFTKSVDFVDGGDGVDGVDGGDGGDGGDGDDDDVTYLMSKARCPANKQLFYNLGKNKGDTLVTLGALLKGKSFVEHPIIHIVNVTEINQFNVYVEEKN